VVRVLDFHFKRIQIGSIAMNHAGRGGRITQVFRGTHETGDKK
jgi:hypothetical protein